MTFNPNELPFKIFRGLPGSTSPNPRFVIFDWWVQCVLNLGGCRCSPAPFLEAALCSTWGAATLLLFNRRMFLVFHTLCQQRTVASSIARRVCWPNLGSSRLSPPPLLEACFSTSCLLPLNCWTLLLFPTICLPPLKISRLIIRDTISQTSALMSGRAAT
jgi:hypothetical protein